MRYKKIVGNAKIDYYYNGTELLLENRNGIRLYYIYGVTGIEGMFYKGQYYYYDKNTLGDIIAIRDDNGNVIARYSYDAWGNHKVYGKNGAVDRNKLSIGNVNPFRYRSYYYDTETGFYYLQTRYYDPTICRFINADDYELVAYLSLGIGELNMYAYCGNNPIMYTDETGTFALSIAGGLGIILVGLFVVSIEAIYHPVSNLILDISNSIGEIYRQYTYSSNNQVGFNQSVSVGAALIDSGLNFSRERNRGRDSGFIGVSDAELETMLIEAKRQGDTQLVKRIITELKKRRKRNSRKQRGGPHMRGFFWLLLLLECDYENS